MTNSLSPMEKLLLDRLLIHQTPEQFAQERGIKKSTVYQSFKRIRKKYREARAFVNMMDSKYRSKTETRKYLWVKEFA